MAGVVGTPYDLTRFCVYLPDRNSRRCRASPTVVERGACVNIRMSVLYAENGSAVRIVKYILHPNKLEGIEIKAQKQAAVIGNYHIMVNDNRAVLHAEPVFIARAYSHILPLDNIVGSNRKAARILIKPCVELHYIEYSVLTGIDDLIRFSADKSRGIKAVPVSVAEALVLTELVHDSVVNEIDDKYSRSALSAVHARADIHNRISPRIESACALKGEADVHRITGFFARFKLVEMYVTVH